MLTSFMSFKRSIPIMSLAAAIAFGSVAADHAATAQPKHESKHAESDAKRQGAVDGASVSVLRAAPLRQVQVIATGYTAGIESTGKKPGHPQYGITYSGVKVRRDLVSTIAADPKIFPIGTLLYVPGYGYAVVADTGSRIKGKKIDLYFETKKQVYKQWGKRIVTVKVLKKGGGKLTEAWLKTLNNAVIADQAVPAELLKS